MRYLPAIVIIMFCAALAGCGQRITNKNLKEVKMDMAAKEVESILGQPTKTSSHNLTLQTQMKTLPAVRYYYEQDGKTVELVFVEDKLVGMHGTFGDDSKKEISKENHER